MELALAGHQDKAVPVHRLARHDVTDVRPARSKAQIAIGFESNRSWVAAQWGGLAIRKETRVNPQATSIHLCQETDFVKLDVGPGRVVVSRGTTCLEVSCGELSRAVRVLLASSAAVSVALALGAELQDDDVHAAEMTLLSVIHFVRALVGGEDWTWFLNDEAAWSKALNGIRPMDR